LLEERENGTTNLKNPKALKALGNVHQDREREKVWPKKSKAFNLEKEGMENPVCQCYSYSILVKFYSFFIRS